MTELADLLLENTLAFIEGEGSAGLDLDALRAEADQHAIRCEAVARAVAAVPAPRPLVVLEVGVGYGYVTTTLRRALGDEVELYGLDHPDRAYLDDGAFRPYVTQVRMTFAALDVLEAPIPWPDVSFDAIVLSEIVEHIPPTRVVELLRQVRRRLSPSGRVIVTSPNLRSLHRRLSLAIGRGHILDLPLPVERAGGTYGHLRLYTVDEMEDLFDEVGLRVSASEFLNWETIYVESRPLRVLQRTLPRLAPMLSTSWLLVGVDAGT